MKTTKLGDICELISRGISPKYTEDRKLGVTVLNQKCIRYKAVLYEFSRLHNLSVRSVNEVKFVKSGDVLINSTGHGTLGRTALAEDVSKPILVDSHITILRPIGGLFEPRYFGYLIGRSENDFIEMSTGTSGQTELPRALLNEYEIHYEPSLEEQRRIVARLDAAFEKIDQAIELTEINVKNINQLFLLVRNSHFNTLKYKPTRIGDVAVIKSGGTPSKKHDEYWKDGSISWYSSGELNDQYTIKPNTYITDVGLKNSTAKVFPKGSLLVGMYDTAAMKMSVLDRDAAFNQAISGIEPNDNIDINYIYHALYFMKDDILRQRTGTRQQNLNLAKIKNIHISIPPKREQVRIGLKMDDVMNYSYKIQSLYKTKILNLAQLKESLLTQAFSQDKVQ